MLTGSEFLSYGAQKVTPSTVGRCLADETHIPEVVVWRAPHESEKRFLTDY